ncbi:MAG TPA: xanthine dehydrogenase family protein molybdopterin-binding subunit [Ktedonobacterales bacterium]|nr:xanthine dehydrogenase family protein molybdopterin-binding subunit [Ktedonobacterales bacterium]
MAERHAPKGFEPGFARRREDERLITGRGQYVDDLRSPAGRPEPLIMAVVRSPYAHARIGAVQTGQASAVPGVVAVHSGRELAGALPVLASAHTASGARIEWRPLAIDTALYAGHPVAAALAETGYAAADARALVEVEYEPLAAVTDAEQALAPSAPVLYERVGSNELYRIPVNGGDIEAAFARADGVVKLRLVNQRLAASPMEPRACMFDFDPETGQLTAWVSSQGVFRVRLDLAEALHIPSASIQVINADTGGAFGTKIGLLGEEIVAALLAVRYGRPVKWIEDRSENIQANVHGRAQINDIEAAYTADGRVLGLRVRIFGDLGAFPGHEILRTPEMFQARSARWLNGPYRFEAISAEVFGALTNAVPVGAYRGAGRPEATYMLERVMDAVARELKLDPVDVRRRNLLTPDMFPYTTPTGSVYDSGNYQAALDKALELVDYSSWRSRQRERRARGERNLLGIGVATFTETSGGRFGPADGPQEAATVRIMPDGTILVQSGVASNGQGHFTSFAQIAASVFAIPGDRVTVHMGDSALPGFSIGTFGSRVTQIAGSAVLLAAEAAREKAVKLAADRLEAAPDDLVVADGRITVRGVPSRGVELGELARAVEAQPQLIEREAPNPANGAPIEGLAAWRSFTPPDTTVGSGAHIAIVEVDGETGETRILRYVAVDDFGRVLNHHLAEAQVHGSLAQGIGQALYEEIAYGPDGQIVSGSLLDYALPKASQLPRYELGNVETPAPGNPLGAKGVGEAGTIAAPPTIVNAVLDALAPLGVTSIDMPLRPEKVWALMRKAEVR